MISWDRLQSEKSKYNEVPEDIAREIDGWIGVSCVLAYIKGVKANASDMARHFGVTKETIERPFQYLLRAGIFSNQKKIRNNSELLGSNCPSFITRNAWCHIAGVASGYC
jgi:transcription initiation factor IIE alpha subunit|tara:strand:- start:5550 stop:5879 length:330 start_codon:yes stop_codon:yes gene_type:complete